MTSALPLASRSRRLQPSPFTPAVGTPRAPLFAFEFAFLVYHDHLSTPFLCLCESLKERQSDNLSAQSS